MRRDIRIHAARDGSVDEHRALLRHLLGLLLSHRTPQQVGAAERVARQHLRDLHDLLLVQDDPVGRLQGRFQARMQIVDLLAGLVVLALDEVIDHARLQRSGPEQRHQGHDVLEAVRPQAPDQILHTARFQLEDRRRAARLQQLIGLLIDHRQLVDVERRLAAARTDAVDDDDRPVDDRQRPQAEEVEFDQARGFDVVLVELRDQIAAVLVAEQRSEIGQHRRRDDHTAGMHAGIACQTLERAREVDHVLDLVLGVVELAQLRLLGERIVERDSQLEGNQLRDAVDEAVGHTEHAADVTHDRLRGHRAVGDDLRYPLAAVFRGHVVDDSIPAIHAEVHVEVRHGHALGIEEALEQQVVADRIEVGDAQAVGHERARTGAAAGPYRHAVLARPADKVGDDQEVPGEAHLTDDIQLAAQPGAVFVEARLCKEPRHALRETARRCVAQKIFSRRISGHRILRQPRLTELQHQRAARGDLESVAQRLGHIREQLGHLRWRAQILLPGVAARPSGIGKQGAVVNTHARLMRLEVFRFEKPYVVGRDDRNATPRCQRHCGSDIPLFLRPPDTLQFDVEAVGKQLQPKIEGTFSFSFARIGQAAANVAFSGARQSDQAVEILPGQPAAIDRGLATLLAFLVGTADQARHVPITGLRLAQQADFGGLLALAGLVNQQIDAHDGLDAVRQRLAVELHHREQIALIRHRDRRHAAASDRAHQFGHADDAVDQRVFGMKTKMDEALRHVPFREDFKGALFTTGPQYSRILVVLPQKHSLIAPSGRPHRTEGPAVQRRRRLAAQGLQMCGGAIALVGGQLEARVTEVQAFHHRVPERLGENRGRADGRDARVSLNDRLRGTAEPQVVQVRQAVAIDLHMRRAYGKTHERATHCEERRAENIQ